MDALLRSGARADVKSGLGLTALQQAESTDHHKVAELLRSRSANASELTWLEPSSDTLVRYALCQFRLFILYLQHLSSLTAR